MRSFLAAARTVGAALALPDLPQALSLCDTLPLWKEGPSPAARERRERVRRIARTSASFPEFLDTVLLQREEDGPWSRAEAVSLLTLHASKGLEWPVVFIIGCEDGILPLEGGGADRDEERRLLYVGMSRARDLLYLTGAARRFFRGEERARAPSPFLADIGELLMHRDDAGSPRKSRRKPDAEQLRLF
jgi:superfamily I DNA/RNA helicase